VLVVDDNHDAADSLSLLIGSMGQDVFTAYDGESALAAAHGFRPDVVLLDIGMPHMSGYEVAQSLRETGAEQPAVLVAITGWGQDADRERATAAGFRYHFVKPIGEAVLRTILEEIAVARRG
jgi:CheY-like chemotaxis protein